MTVFSSINPFACAPLAPGSAIHTGLGLGFAEALVSADTERGQVPLAQQPKMETRYE